MSWLKNIFCFYLVFVVFFYAIVGFFLPDSITTRADIPGVFKIVRDLVWGLVLYLFVLQLLLKRNRLQIAPGLLLLIVLYIVYVFVQSLRFYIEKNETDMFVLLLANRNALEYIPLLFIPQFLIKSKAELVKFTNFMIVLFFVLALIGIFQFKMGGSNRFYSLADPSGAQFRATGTMNNPSAFGITVNLGIILLIGNIKHAVKFLSIYKGVFIRLTILIIMFLASISAKSLSSVAALLSGLACLSLLKRKAGYILLLIFYAIISCILIFDKVINTVNLTSPSFLIRLGLWKTAVPNVFHSFWIGYGTGSYGATAGTLGINQITDNYYLSLLLQYGIIGFVIFFLIVFVIFFKTLRLLKTEKDLVLNSIVTSLLACIVALLTVNLAGDFLEAFPINVWFWLFLGLLLRYPYIRETQTILPLKNVTLV